MVYDIKVTDKDNPHKTLSFSNAPAIMGSAAVYGILPDAPDHLDFYLVFGAGPAALMAPFSEIIPVAVGRTIMEHRNKIRDPDRPQVAIEAMSESISTVLARELAQREEVPDAKRLLAQAVDDYADNPRYGSVPAARKMLAAVGVQDMFDLYCAGPEQFLKQLEAYR